MSTGNCLMKFEQKIAVLAQTKAASYKDSEVGFVWH